MAMLSGTSNPLLLYIFRTVQFPHLQCDSSGGPVFLLLRGLRLLAEYYVPNQAYHGGHRSPSQASPRLEVYLVEEARGAAPPVHGGSEPLRHQPAVRSGRGGGSLPSIPRQRFASPLRGLT